MKVSFLTETADINSTIWLKEDAIADDFLLVSANFFGTEFP